MNSHHFSPMSARLREDSTRTPRFTNTPELSWRRLYEDAILELHPEMLHARIKEAQNAVFTELACLGDSQAQQEREALNNALIVLDDLVRIYGHE
jgi:hypothetical protein